MMTTQIGFRMRLMALVIIAAMLSLVESDGKANLPNDRGQTEHLSSESKKSGVVKRDLKAEAEAETEATAEAEALQKCQEGHLKKPYPTDGRLYCNSTWDGWACWDYTPAGYVAEMPCPYFIKGFNPKLKASKVCTKEGTWFVALGKAWTNYTTCVDKSEKPIEGYNVPAVKNNPSEIEMDNAKRMAAEKCYEEVLFKPYPTDGRLYCNRTFDGWGCWNDTAAGEVAETFCPSFMEGFDPRLKANKICTGNGSWWVHPMTGKTWSNYTTCVDRSGMQTDKAVLTVFIAGYSASIIAMVLSLVIFFTFKQLNCDRITLHKNLFISYVLNGLLWILFYTMVASDPVVLGRNPLWCRVMHFFTSYFTVCNFFWMFNEGLYLHTVIVVAFFSGKKLLIACHLVGWVLPLIPVIIYTVLRATSSDEHQKLSCWLHETDLHWINAGPVVASLVLNFIFLTNIIRVLITKLRAVNSPDTNQTKKAVRATIILVPLLGLQYIIIPFRPAPNSTEERVYLVLAALLVSFQGLFVALIFCFFNGEVVALMKRKYGQRRMMRAYNGSRRGTYCTTVTMAPVDSVSHAPPLTSPNDDAKVISIVKRKWGQHQLMRGNTMIGKAQNCTTVTQSVQEYNMHTDSGKKPLNCDPTSPCLENSVSDQTKSKKKHKFYRSTGSKQKEGTNCCSAV